MYKPSLFLLLSTIFLNIIPIKAALSSESLKQSAEPPVIPVGLDAYLMWDRLPYHRIGIRAYMRSTYDREGNNRTADASHFLYQESNSFNVSLDVKGTGVFYFKRTNHFHGSPWHYEVDGEDFIVKETATDDPIDAKNRYLHTEFIPQELFPAPLTWTWSTTKGADLMWVPLPFEKSFRIAYSRTLYGTGYYIYHMFPQGIKHISRKIKSWDKTPPDPKVLELINKSGTDIAPAGGGVSKFSGRIELKPFQWTTVCNLNEAPSTIRAFKFVIPRESAYEFGKCRLRITWDNRWHASIDAPVDLFFGAGHLYNNDGREYLVKGFPLVIRYNNGKVYLSCYWPMPYFKNAKIEIQERSGETLKDIDWEIRQVPFDDPVNHAAYFHATYSDHPEPELGKDNIFLDTDAAEGGGPWSGHFVGMSWTFSRRGNLRTLEGDPRFFFDGSRTPQAWGTGTEEWGGGGDYWGGQNMTIPFAGHPVGSTAEKAENDKDLINSAYRFLIADFFPFGNRAVIGLEHGGMNTIIEHYSGVVYWYGVNASSLILTDELNVCNEEDISVHNYRSPTAEKPYSLVSRYEWGQDNDNKNWSHPKDEMDRFYGARLFFPAEEDSVRIMRGTTRFRVKLDTDNLGVLLRRKFDYLYPNQHAKVYVKPLDKSEWNYAGEWYTAGSNTCVYSYPKGRSYTEAELAPAEHQIITGNRRWREEEFLIPRQLTEGIDTLEVKIEFVPDSKELFPGQPFPAQSAWSESRYYVYCYKMPKIVFE